MVSKKWIITYFPTDSKTLGGGVNSFASGVRSSVANYLQFIAVKFGGMRNQHDMFIP